MTPKIRYVLYLGFFILSFGLIHCSGGGSPETDPGGRSTPLAENTETITIPAEQTPDDTGKTDGFDVPQKYKEAQISIYSHIGGNAIEMAACASSEGIDMDEDNVPDHLDNCPSDYNPRQDDLNTNGIGDICEKSFPLGKTDHFFFNGSIAIDFEGNVFTLDQNYHRVEKFNSEGKFLQKFGHYGANAGEFSFPSAISMDTMGQFYIVDLSNSTAQVRNRVQQFSPQGNFINQWGTVGSNPSQFFHIEDRPLIHVNNNIYIVDGGNHRVQIFSNDGSFIKTIGSQGLADGQFMFPRKIWSDSAGFIYVNDTIYEVNKLGHIDSTKRIASRIQKFNSEGTFLNKWLSSKVGFLHLVTDQSANIYILQTDPPNIKKISSNGTVLKEWGSSGNGDGQFISPSGILIDQNNDIYIVDPIKHDVQKFDAEGAFLMKWSIEESDDKAFFRYNFTIDSDNNLYVVNPYAHRIHKINTTLGCITKFGSLFAEKQDGKFKNPSAIAIDATGNIYTIDTRDHLMLNFDARIQKFSSNGMFLQKFGEKKEVTFERLSDVAVDSTGNVYVIDQNRIDKYSSNGAFLKTLIENSDPKITFSNVALDPNGNIYVAEFLSIPPPAPPVPRIRKFDSEGNFLKIFLTADPSFVGYRIASDTQGSIYVITPNNLIQKVTPEGTLIKQWGSHGTGNGQFQFPQGITTDLSGNIYISDSKDYRIQKFNSDGEYLTTWNLEALLRNKMSYIIDLATDAIGNLYVVNPTQNLIHKFDTNGNELFE